MKVPICKLSCRKTEINELLSLDIMGLNYGLHEVLRPM